MAEKIFVKGVRVTKPFADGSTINLGIYMPDFEFHAKQFTKESGWVDIAICQSTSDASKWYAEFRQPLKLNN